MSLLRGGGENGIGLLNLPETKSGPQHVKSEIKVKDGIVKNPKKRKLYAANPDLQKRGCVSFAQSYMQNLDDKYKTEKTKELITNRENLQTATKKFMSILENDQMNPFGNGSMQFHGPNFASPVQQVNYN